MTEGKRHGDWAYSLALFGIALLPRLFVAIAWSREPVWDGHYYHFGAERIANGLGYSEDVLIGGSAVWKPWCHYPVGYSGFLALFYSVLGAKLWVAPVLNALVGGASALCVHRIGLKTTTPTRARVAGGLVALHPGLIAYSSVVMTEGLAAFLLVLAPALWLGVRKKPWGAVAAGVVLGLATLVRPSSLLAAPALALLGARSPTKAMLRAALATALALVVVLPWTVRNCKVMDGCALVSTNGGWNLAIGALTKTGRFRTLRAADGCPEVPGQVQQDRCWATVGRAAIANAPARWLALIPKKLGHTYDHESFAIEYLREANPDAWAEDRRRAGRTLLSTFHRLLLVAAALSIIGWPPRGARLAWAAQVGLAGLIAALSLYATASIEHPFFWLPALLPLLALLPLPGRPTMPSGGRYALAMVFATSLTHAIFFGDDRYHLVISPLLCLLAAMAIRPSGVPR